MSAAGEDRSALPPEWLAAALDPPRAGGPPPVSGQLRVAPEDFAVEERLGFEPDGGAAHLLLQVEKTDSNTLYVARALARFGGVRAADVGFAGLKDRRAVALQWFSVPAGRPPAEWQECEQQGFRVLQALAHSRKLRRGALAGNRFRIVVRGLAGDLAAIEPGLARLASQGAPNYFGPQRFGREAGNLAAVARWIDAGRLPRDREQRAFLISAARSLVFNGVLATRVAQGSWNRLLPGEVVNLSGTGSVFVAEDIDATLEARCEALDVHPTGPLAGRGGKLPVGQVAQLEAAAVAPFVPVLQALEGADVDASRRPLRIPVGGLDGSLEDDVLRLSFELGRGAFATAVLREILDIDGSELPSGED